MARDGDAQELTPFARRKLGLVNRPESHFKGFKLLKEAGSQGPKLQPALCPWKARRFFVNEDQFLSAT